MEVLRLEVRLELQLPAYTTATAMLDLSHIFNLHHNSWQCWILNLPSEAKDSPCILMDTSQIHFHWATMRIPQLFEETVFLPSLFPFLFFVLIVLLVCCCCCFRAMHLAYGFSQAKGWIGATAAGLHYSHSHARSEPSLWPTPMLTAMPNP